LRAVAQAATQAGAMTACALHLVSVQPWLSLEAAEAELARRAWQTTARARTLLDARGQPWRLHVAMGETAEQILALAAASRQRHRHRQPRFAMTGFMGYTLGPVISRYLGLPNGGEIVMQAMGGTAAIFIGLSAYAVTTKKDFSFMGGFLMVGILLAFLAGLGAIFFQIPALSLTVSAAFVLLMSGLILYETGNIIHGGETNYVLATVTLFVSIFNLFTSLLQLLGFMNGDD
jgi:FtsH-binding integral membrane protein